MSKAPSSSERDPFEKQKVSRPGHAKGTGLPWTVWKCASDAGSAAGRSTPHRISSWHGLRGLFYRRHECLQIVGMWASPHPFTRWNPTQKSGQPADGGFSYA